MNRVLNPAQDEGRPARVVIDEARLREIQGSFKDTVDAVAPVATRVLQAGVNLAIDASAIACQAQIGIPSVAPAIGSCAAGAKAAARSSIETSVQRSVPAVKDAGNRSIQRSVAVVNSSFQE